MKFVTENKLPCGHEITFGPCGIAGEAHQLTHQKDGQVALSYNQFFAHSTMYPKPQRLLEIGVCRGGSLAIWSEMFGDDCDIIGVDINLGQVMPGAMEHLTKCKKNISVHHMNMPDKKIQDLGEFDIIIDDGGHGPKAVLPAFELCWSMLRPNGLYIVEDWRQHFLEPHTMMKYFVDKLIQPDDADLPAPDAPISIISYRGFFAMRKRS